MADSLSKLSKDIPCGQFHTRKYWLKYGQYIYIAM